MTRMRTRRGIALFAALALMALIALLVAGAVASSTVAQRSARMSFTDAMLTAAADYALNTILADPPRFGLADLTLGQRTLFEISVPTMKDARVFVGVTRLPGGVLWLVADAASTDVDQGHRRFNLIARFPVVGALPEAGLVARGNVQLGHDVLFQTDTSHDAECSAHASVDVVVAPGARVSGGDSSRVAIRSSAADTSAYLLAASTRAVLDSARTIIHVRGDTAITGGSGNDLAGILIVDGSVTITGAYVATGLIVARGRIQVSGGGFSLVGAMLSFAEPAADPAIDVSDAIVRYSPCAVAHAFRTALAPHPVSQRSWGEVF
jgi:hypothetical protein